MSARLKELEKRLKQEPNNLGLRVMVAGAMREAGRSNEAVELYRSVALAYRDQGRPQQAVAVCRSILEIAPDDVACQGLMSSLMDRLRPATAPPAGRPPTAPAARPPTQPAPPSSAQTEPKRRSSLDETPLPRPIPYHVAEPTSAAARMSPRDLDSQRDLPAVEDAPTRPGEGDRGEQRRDLSGLAEAARRISGLLGDTVREIQVDDVSDSLDTRKVHKVDTDQLRKISGPPPSVDTDRVDALTPVPRDSDELTEPRELVPPPGKKK